MSKLEVLHISAFLVVLGFSQWVPNLVLRQHADSQSFASRMQDNEVRFWTKHISLHVWSPICVIMHTPRMRLILWERWVWVTGYRAPRRDWRSHWSPAPVSGSWTLSPWFGVFPSQWPPFSEIESKWCWNCLPFWRLSYFNNRHVHYHRNWCIEVLGGDLDSRLFQPFLYWVSSKLGEFCLYGRGFSYRHGYW